MTNYYHIFRRARVGSWVRLPCLCLLGFLLPCVYADSGVSAYLPVEFQSGQGIGPERAGDIVQANIVGKVLSISSGTHKGRPIYRVKVLLTGGRVMVMRVSAEDGNLLD